MSFEIIERIAKYSSQDSYKSLINGYTRSLTDDESIDFFKRNLFNKNYSNALFRRICDITDTEKLENLVSELQNLFNISSSYFEKRRICYYLNKLIYISNEKIKINILLFFLNSDKRYIRKYAYKFKDLSYLGLFEKAWCLIIDNPEEASDLIHTLAYGSDDKLINEYFDRAINHQFTEEYQIRQLFKRHCEITQNQWQWLKINYPGSYLYVAAVKNHNIDNASCLEIYDNIVSINKIENNQIGFSYMPEENLYLWCLAKLGKWSVIEEISKEILYEASA